MAKGKRQYGRPPAGGIKRNDHHRRNRKRNISTHSHSHGVQYPATGVRLIKRKTFESLFLREHNAREHAAFYDHEAIRCVDDKLTDGEYSAALCSLKFQATLYCPPFLSHEEIIARRFSDKYGEMSDRWWEWEKDTEAGVQ